MVFSSNVFLYFFLTVVLVGYAVLYRWRKWSNLFLTLASLGFYAWGQPKFVVVMFASIVVNWLLALWIDREKQKPERGHAKLALVIAIVLNLGLLGVYKYLGWLLGNVKAWFNLSFPVPEIALPIGISFFTFQAMSYVIDVYRGDGKVQRNFINVCLYVSFFPQLIAGPIVRYQTVADEIENRRENLTDFTAGVHRFMLGFCKKTLLANNLGLLVDTLFGLDHANLSVGGAWIAACAYLMQVYYDFSGYSDMAIGLGRMFGFHFLENFRFPFVSKSVAEFWSRWHISLTSWFQDYLYFPLGGSRVKSKARLIFNMFMVWSLTGSRILGMGDVLSLIEKAQESFDEQQAVDLTRKMRTNSFTLEDYLEQMKQLNKMGSITDVLKMIPGLGSKIKDTDIDEDKVMKAQKKNEAIILSMTRMERRNPDILNASRKRRIAAGSGTTVQEVNLLLKQFDQAKEMMKNMMGGMKGGKMKRMMRRFGQ